MEDILRYSRDMGSRNTLWIPDDFEVDALIEFLKENCIPGMVPIKAAFTTFSASDGTLIF